MLVAFKTPSSKIFSAAALVGLSLFLSFNFGLFDLRPTGCYLSSLQRTNTCKVKPAAVATPLSVASLASNPTGIPEKIWYKLGPKGLSKDAEGWIDSCLTINPTYRHEFLTDANGENYVREHFGHRSDIIDTYFALTIPILKADLLRYLILFAEGGIWSDLDISCDKRKTIHEWIPDQYKRQTNLVVGLEFDETWEDDGVLHSQFASWTIMSKPGSPHMLQVIDDIIVAIREKSEENDVSIEILTTKMVGDVIDLTGPKRMTWSIVASLEKMMQRTLDDRDISGLKEPKLLGDVLILPGNAFADNQNDYPEDEGPVLVQHHYAGSWKNDHGGEMV